MQASDISRALLVGRRLRVDGWTAEAVTALTESYVASVLLKGPAITRWLYADDPESRGYNDVDLLVDPAKINAAHAALERLGYVRLPHPELDRHVRHALPYERPGDRAIVDLHRTLHGLQDVSETTVWEVVARNTVTMVVGGATCTVPSIPVRLMHLILHLSHDDTATTQPWHDLQRALDRCSDTEWEAATAVACELGAEAEVALRLRMIPAGVSRADALGLPTGGSAYFRLREAFETGLAPESAHSLYALMALPSWKARGRYVRGKLWPNAQSLQARYPSARDRRPIELRVAHAAHQLRKLPAAAVAWLRYYRPR